MSFVFFFPILSFGLSSFFLHHFIIFCFNFKLFHPLSSFRLSVLRVYSIIIISSPFYRILLLRFMETQVFKLQNVSLVKGVNKLAGLHVFPVHRCLPFLEPGLGLLQTSPYVLKILRRGNTCVNLNFNFDDLGSHSPEFKSFSNILWLYIASIRK